MGRLLILICGILPCYSALAATGLSVSINDESGCGHGTVTESAGKFCGDFDVANMSSRDKLVAATKARCVTFYQDALRIQNVFCSYQKDAVKFNEAVEASVEVAWVGKANLSEATVSKENSKVATIGRAYMVELIFLSAQIKQHFSDYIVALAQLNGAASGDESFEAKCMVAELKSQVPGHLRVLLASFTWAAARVTYDSMWKATRANLGKLKNMKEEAEHNAQLTETRALEVGQVLKQAVAKPSLKDDSIPLPSFSESGNPLVQYFFTKAVGATSSRLAEGAGIIGSGAVFVFQLATGQQIKFADSAVMFLGVLQPELGLAAGILATLNKRVEAVLELYRTFSQDLLSRDHGNGASITVNELVAIWGKRTKNPRCLQAVDRQADCLKQRSTAQPYDHGACTAPPGTSDITGPAN